MSSYFGDLVRICRCALRLAPGLVIVVGLGRCALKNDKRYDFFAQGGAPPAIVPDAGSRNTEDFSPACLDVGPTEADAEIKKGTACTTQDPQICYRACGPQSVGWKSETCTAATYAEGDCHFPSGDYSCYSIPSTIDMTVCPSTEPKAGEECAVAECTLCNLDGQYFDSSGSNKIGYCVCTPPSDLDGIRRWSCASSTAWPCPQGFGC
jgi:hypothetical protein